MKQVILHGGVGHPMSALGDLEKYASLAIKKETPMEAAIAGVMYMEDDPQFNAGTGSAMRLDGSVQMDASVMVDGDFGAVICIESVKNPVKVARDVMERTNHCILSGDGATDFARKLGYPPHDPSTEKQRIKINKMKEVAAKDQKYNFTGKEATDTVGAVANFDGTIVAALSTGGRSGIPMIRGRVGDTPILGAGILVKGDFGVAGTGSGEEIIKKMLSYHLYSNKDNLDEAWNEVTQNLQGTMGVIGFNGEEPFVFATRPMPTGLAKRD